jgi:hypothetical protein
VVPGLDPEVAVDDVQPHRQRIDHLGHEPLLLLDLGSALGHFALEPLRVLRVAEHRREDVGNGAEEELLLVRQ